MKSINEITQESIEESILVLTLASMHYDGYITESDLDCNDYSGPYLVEATWVKNKSTGNVYQVNDFDSKKHDKPSRQEVGAAKKELKQEKKKEKEDLKAKKKAEKETIKTQKKAEKQAKKDAKKKPEKDMDLVDVDTGEEHEAHGPAVNKQLEKLGFTVHKTKGIIDYVKDFTQGVGRIAIAAMKGDKEEVKKIAKSVKQPDVLDFLLKLDMATFHTLTGPIHMIDAITGWDLVANVKHKMEKSKGVMASIKAAIESLKTKIHKLVDNPKKNQMLSPIGQLEQLAATDDVAEE